MWLRYCQYSVKHQEQSIRLRNMVSIFWICPFRNFLENSIVKTMIFGTKGSSAKWNFYDSILHLKNRFFKKPTIPTISKMENTLPKL